MMLTVFRVHLTGTDWETREAATCGSAAIAKAIRKIRAAEALSPGGYSRVTPSDFVALRVDVVTLTNGRTA